METAGVIMDIEDCQRQFTAIIEGIGLLPHSQRLQRLRLTILLEHRMRGDLIETFKIFNGYVNYGHNMFTRDVSYQTRNLTVISHHERILYLIIYAKRNMPRVIRLDLQFRITYYHKKTNYKLFTKV